MDVKLFESTKWTLEEGQEGEQFDSLSLGIVSPQKQSAEPSAEQNLSDQKPSQMRLALIRRFEFVAEKQRMSVIVRNMATQQMIAFVKGSPEKIRELSRPETVPVNFHETLQIYT